MAPLAGTPGVPHVWQHALQPPVRAEAGFSNAAGSVQFPQPKRCQGRLLAVQRASIPVWAASAAGVAATLLPAALVQRARRRRRSNVAKTLQDNIADFYDASSGVWVEIWGEHMHHGYYPKGFRGTLAAHRQAQVDMIEKILMWAGVPPQGSAGAPLTVLDVGCGVGGSSRHLQRKYGSTTMGITLSPWQRGKAQELSELSGQGDVCSFMVADALRMPFPDNSFDLVWSLESGEHMPEKPKFLSELFRVCKPGGRIILVTWVHRDLQPGEALSQAELRLLKRISDAYHLPPWCSIADYAEIARSDLGLVDIQTADWTDNIKPFWGAVIQTAVRPQGWWALARGGWSTLRGALVMPLMASGYSTGTIKFGLLTAVKPLAADRRTGPAAAGEEPAPFSEGAAAQKGAGGGEAAAALASLRGRSVPLWRAGLASSGGGSGSPGCIGLRRPWPKGRGGIRRHQDGSSSETSGSSSRGGLKGVLNNIKDAVKTIWDFSRPHTLLGTLISVPAVHLFAAAPYMASLGLGKVLSVVVASVFSSLPPALLVNVYITGLNQIFDVDIDRVNKPKLPLPAGRLSLAAAWCTCAGCLGSAILWAWSSPARASSWPLHLTLAGSAVLGTAYSAPPVRLKRSPFFAAFCIVVVRGLLVNLGFYCFALEALSQLGVPALGLDVRGSVAAAFFAVFGLVIALMKDVPDVLGDEMHSVRSLSVRVGPERVLNAATRVLWCLLGAASAAFAGFAVSATVAGCHALAIQRALLGLVCLQSLRFAVARRQGINARDSAEVYGLYMDVWRIFYASYLCLPFAR